MTIPAMPFPLLTASPRVLIADDQASVSDALAFLLKMRGVQADVVTNPAEVLERVRSRRYELLLMDMNYEQDTTSGEEGLRLVDAVRAIDPALGMVVMTAWSTVEIAVAALQRGASDFIQKPWDNDTAARVITEQIAATARRRHEQAIATAEQEQARQVQRSLMGSPLTYAAPFTVAAESRSSRMVGGDYFDVVPLAGAAWMVCVADVMGKGMGAALMMANFQAQFRAAVVADPDPASVATYLNRQVRDSSFTGRLVTAFFGALHVEERRFTYTCAGHPAAILQRANGDQERLTTEDAVLGGVEDWAYRAHCVTLDRGDCIAIFSDGYLEAVNPSGEEAGEALLEAWLREKAMASAEEIKLHLAERLLAYSAGEIEDDATAMVIAYA